MFNNKYLQDPVIVKGTGHLFLTTLQRKREPIFKAVNLNVENVVESVVLAETFLPILLPPPSIIIPPTLHFVYMPSAEWTAGPLKSRIIQRPSLTLQFTE